MSRLDYFKKFGYRCWKFLQGAVDLQRLEPVAHTAFRAAISTPVVDLRKAPFSQDADQWMHRSDYSATQAFAATAREAALGGIVYQSMRDPDAGWCVAVLTPLAFASTKPDGRTQTWWIAVQQDAVVCRREQESFFSRMHKAELWTNCLV